MKIHKRTILFAPALVAVLATGVALALPQTSAARVKAASCGCSLASRSMALVSAPAFDLAPADYVDQDDMTPQQRFNVFVSDLNAVRNAQVAQTAPPVVVNMSSVTFTAPSGVVARWDFGTDGFVTVVTIGNQAVRYHYKGDALWVRREVPE